jgi:serine/threonine protein kinase
MMNLNRPASPEHLATLARTARKAVEAWLLEFDQGWHENLLAQTARALPLDQCLRRAALLEMVKIDLERKWHLGHSIALESYLTLYPELGSVDVLPPDVIAVEFEVRRQAGAAADWSDFSRRFPRQAPHLRQHLHESVREERLTPFVQDPAATLSSGDKYTAESLPVAFGRYRLLKKLGQGGMGRVYLAHDPLLDRQVALKVPTLSVEDGPEVLQRFTREAQAVAALHHPHLCPVYDVGIEQGTPYLTMAYLDGMPLSEAISAEVFWAPDRAARLVRLLALALADAHAHGVIHRDLKPANVILTPRGDPVLTDFGLARRLLKDDIRLTQPGSLVGTPAYMAPEQTLGSTASQGPACDIYSLGVVFYELITGRLPFTGSLMDVLVKIATEPPQPPSKLRPGLNPGWDRICLRALAKSPGDRFQSMGEFALAVENVLGLLEEAQPRRTPELASGTSLPSRPVALQKKRWLAVAFLGCLLALGGSAVWWAISETWEPADHPRNPVKETKVNPAPAQDAEFVPAFSEVFTSAGHAEAVWSVAIEGQKRKGISISGDGTARWWDLDIGEELPDFRLKMGVLGPTAVLSADGRHAVCGVLQSARMWDMASRKEMRTVPLAGPHLGGMTFSGDSRRFAAGMQAVFGEPLIQVWDVESGEPVARLEEGHREAVGFVALSNDGRRALSAGKGGVHYWDVEAGKVLQRLARDVVTCLAFSRDDKQFFLGEATGVILLCDSGRAGEPRRYSGHQGAVHCLAYFPDSRRLYSGSEDGSVRVWNVEAGTELACLSHTAGVTSLAVAADERRLLVGTKDGRVRLWEIKKKA